MKAEDITYNLDSFKGFANWETWYVSYIICEVEEEFKEEFESVADLKSYWEEIYLLNRDLFESVTLDRILYEEIFDCLNDL